jgi:TRAP transporter TAXI family solute receptor
LFRAAPPRSISIVGSWSDPSLVTRGILPALIALTCWLPRAEAQQVDVFTVGSGNVSGGYYEAARAICNAFNRREADARCSPEPTAGSLYNLEMLRDGQLDFAFAQSDWQGAALHGIGAFAAKGAMTGLRSVMSLYPEMITILARRDAGIEGFGDLIGKRLDIGPPGSGRNASLSRIIEMLDLGPADFSRISELPAESAMSELCAGRIDATILIVGHPNATVGQTLRDCDVTLVPFGGQKVDATLAATPELRPFVIRSATYPEVTAEVPTYAVIATIVTRADVDPEIVQTLVTVTLSDLREIKVRAPVLRGLTADAMRREGLTAPLHPGAEAAFAQSGG